MLHPSLKGAVATDIQVGPIPYRSRGSTTHASRWIWVACSMEKSRSMDMMHQPANSAGTANGVMSQSRLGPASSGAWPDQTRARTQPRPPWANSRWLRISDRDGRPRPMSYRSWWESVDGLNQDSRAVCIKYISGTGVCLHIHSGRRKVIPASVVCHLSKCQERLDNHLARWRLTRWRQNCYINARAKQSGAGPAAADEPTSLPRKHRTAGSTRACVLAVA
jgi:hypothetical protein